MVALIPLDRIQQLNIDTVERAIVLGYLGLYFATGSDESANNELLNRIRLDILSRSDGKTDLKIEARISLNPETFIKSGGRLLDSIQPFAITGIDLTDKFDFTIAATEPAIASFPQYPSELVRNFETYSYYYTLVLANSVTENRNRVVSIRPRRNGSDGQFLDIDITLPLDPSKWLAGKSLIESVERVTDQYQTAITFAPQTVQLSRIDQETALGNQERLGN